jgi:hypothetical protein
MLSAAGVAHFDAWAANFGEPVTSLELAPDGSGYRMHTRFARFVNLPELLSMFRELSVRMRRTFGRGMDLNFGGISRLDSDEQLVPFLVLARFCRASTGKGLIEQFHI